MAGTPTKIARRERAAKLMATTEYWTLLFDDLASGGNLPDFAKGSQIPWRMLFSRIENNPELRKCYETAKLARAKANEAKIDALASRVENGEISPDAGRVCIDARKWLASRLDPATYGERTQHDVKVTSIQKLHLEAHAALARRMKIIPETKKLIES